MSCLLINWASCHSTSSFFFSKQRLQESYYCIYMVINNDLKQQFKFCSSKQIKSQIRFQRTHAVMAMLIWSTLWAVEILYFILEFCYYIVYNVYVYNYMVVYIIFYYILFCQNKPITGLSTLKANSRIFIYKSARFKRGRWAEDN